MGPRAVKSPNLDGNLPLRYGLYEFPFAPNFMSRLQYCHTVVTHDVSAVTLTPTFK